MKKGTDVDYDFPNGGLLSKLHCILMQDAHEETKSVTKASAMKGNCLLLIPGFWFMYMMLFATLLAVASLTFL